MKKIIYILSTNYAGSHLLSLLIGSHSRFQHIGEVRGLGKPKKPNRQYCGICNGHENCPVLRGINPENINQVYDIVFSNVGPNISGLVDTSKKTSWAQRFLSDTSYEKKFVFLLRDPRALIRRWLMDEKMNSFRERLKLIKYPPRYFKLGLSGSEIDIYIGKWLQQNWKTFNFIRENSLDRFVLTYHDLVVNESESMRQLMEWAGEALEPGQIQYWNFTHHGSVKYQYKETKAIHLDSRWKEYLSHEQQMRISTHPGILDFLQSAGVKMVDNGLTKC